MIRRHSHELISDKGWQLSNYGSSNNHYGLGFVFFVAHVAFRFSACKGNDCISRIDCFACFVYFLFPLYIVIFLNSLNKFHCHYLPIPILQRPHFHPRLHFADSTPPPHPSTHHVCLHCYSIRIKKLSVLNIGLVRVDVCIALWTQC
jgi:hypothetical protein